MTHLTARLMRKGRQRALHVALMVSLKQAGGEAIFELVTVAVRTRLQSTGKIVMTNLKRHHLHQLHREHSPLARPKTCILRGQQSLGRLRTPTINWPMTIHGLRMLPESGASCFGVFFNLHFPHTCYVVFLLTCSAYLLYTCYVVFAALTLSFGFLFSCFEYHCCRCYVLLFIYFMLHP